MNSLGQSTWVWSTWLWGLLVAFVLGWIACRWDWRQGSFENRHSRRAYFKGLCLLLNEQHDQAVDTLIEATRHDADAVDLHFALGRLFRRRGEYERAVRVHTHLLEQLQLKTHDRLRAQYALAQDFLKAGLFDRAQALLKALRGTTWNTQALEGLLYIAEKMRDWTEALSLLEYMKEAGLGNLPGRQAHYLCEQALIKQASRDESAQQEALHLLEQAHHLAPLAIRPVLEQSVYWARHGQAQRALHMLTQALEQALERNATNHIPLLARAIRHLLGQEEVPELVFQDQSSTLAALERAYQQTQSVDVLQAWIRLGLNGSNIAQTYRQHVQAQPQVLSVLLWLFHEGLSAKDTDLKESVGQMIASLLRYRCAACGFESSEHFWSCPACQTWDSYGTRPVGEEYVH
jgi:lipopolysaccharide biosynthesis regulator YciM